ncbi:hypothetical protein HDU76_007473 [Blyttiomyces sp. JEL0837]|nr:hypothetical protein HDU76_007473 [Blyttiomyces sp. JEL0837]
MDVAATTLHYGQSCFEGLKAFRMRDGKIRIFRPELNAKRLQLSCAVSSMPSPPIPLFLEALQRVVTDNIDYVPPISTNGSLYIRPFVIGTGPQVGLSPAPEFAFVIYVVPVGDYYKGGMGNPVKAIIARDLDRAAAFGTGHVKLGGNYAPVFASTAESKVKGFTVNLFLDSKTNSLVEEFATSNFAALKKDGDDNKWVYVTPRSRSILAGVTNRSLAELASRALNWKVERREVTWEEVKSGAFVEVVAAGTAVVMTPVGEIHRELPSKVVSVQKKKISDDGVYNWDDDEEVVTDKVDGGVEIVKFGEDGFVEFRKLYKIYRDLQYGDLPEWQSFGWMWPAEGL